MFRQREFVPAFLPCAILAGVLFLLDLGTPLGMADGFFYIIVVIVAAFSLPHSRAGRIAAAVCTALILLGQFLSPPGEFFLSVLNRSFAVVML